MSDSFVQVPPDSSGKMLDAESLTVGANTVLRQRFELSGAAAAAIAALANAAPAGTEYGLITRPIMPATTTVATADATASGNITAAQPVIGTPVANAAVTLACAGNSAAVFAVTGTGVGTTWVVDASLDGTNWFPWNFVNPVTGAILSSIAATSGIWQVGTAGLESIRVRASAYTSGTATVTARASNATHLISADNTLLVSQGTKSANPTVGWWVNVGDSTTGSAVAVNAEGGMRVALNHYAVTAVTAQSASAGAICTCTLPAAGAGLFHYITKIVIYEYGSAAMTASATPISVTTTNLPNTPPFLFPTLLSQGAYTWQEHDFGTYPLKASAANVATTVVGPATTNCIWRIDAFYYTAS